MPAFFAALENKIINHFLVEFIPTSSLGNLEKQDAIFLDINMSEINGWEFLDLYAESANDKASICNMLTPL